MTSVGQLVSWSPGNSQPNPHNFVGMNVIATTLVQDRNQMHDSEFSNKYVYLKKIADKKLFKRMQQNHIKKLTWRKLSHNFSKRETSPSSVSPETEQEELIQVK